MCKDLQTGSKLSTIIEKLIYVWVLLSIKTSRNTLDTDNLNKKIYLVCNCLLLKRFGSTTGIRKVCAILVEWCL